MPQIKEYTAENAALHPTETGIDAAAQAARRIGAFYNQAGETERRAAQDVARGAEGIVRGTKAFVGSVDTGVKSLGQAVDAAQAWVSHAQISNGQKNLFQASDNLTQAWNTLFDQTVDRDPNNGTIQAQFMQGTFEPWAQQYINGFSAPGARDWAEAQVEKLRNHFTQKTSADMVSMAGHAINSNVRNMVTSATNQARTDPSSVDHLLGSIQDSIHDLIDSNPHLKGADALKARTETLDHAQRAIVRAGALGAISNSNDPEHAWQSWAKKYPNLIDATEMDQFAKAARGYQRMNEAETRAQRQEADRVASRKMSSDLINLEMSTVGDDGKSNVTPNTVQKFRQIVGDNPNGAAIMHGEVTSTFKSLQAQLAREGKPEPTAELSNQTQMKLFNELKAPDADFLQIKDRVNDAYGSGQLKWSGRQELLKEIEDRKTPAGQALAQDRDLFFKRYAGTIDPKYDPVFGSPAMYRAEMYARAEEEDLKRKGLDPKLVYDPRSEYFFGAPANLAKFQSSLQQQMTQPVAKATAAPAQSRFQAPANWQFSPSRRQYRDVQGRVYDMNGNPVVPTSQ